MIKSEPVISDYIAVPEDVLQANKDVTFSADIMFVNKIPFSQPLVVISNSLQLRGLKNEQ